MVNRDELGFQFLIIGLILTVSAYGFSFILTTTTDFCIVDGIRDSLNMTKLENCITKTSDFSIATYYVGFAGIVILATSSVLLSKLPFKKLRHIEHKHNTHKKNINYDKVWRDFQYVFWPLLVLLVILFVGVVWNEDTTRSSKIADIAGVLGLFFSIYVAIWAFSTEQRKRSNEKKENIYYKINANDMISNIVFLFNSIFRWTKAWPIDKNKRDMFCQNIIDTFAINNQTILSICNEIQIINLNPHVPADIKDQMYLIMIQTRKIGSNNLTISNIVQYYNLVNDVYSRSQKLFETEYMKDIDELRKEMGNDVLLNLN